MAVKGSLPVVTAPDACGARPPLRARPLMSPVLAGGLAAVFKVLSCDTRLRILHALARTDELCVGALADAVGMKPQAVSNQLQRLADLGVVASRRDGANIRYRLVDRCVTGLLSEGWCLAEELGRRPEFLGPADTTDEHG